MSQQSARFQARYGPWALVAGASEGLGAAWAEALAARGLHLALVARRADRLADLAARLAAQHGIQTRPLALDLAAEDAPASILAATADLDVGLLVYNAALSVIGPFLERPLDAHLMEITVNCRSPLALGYGLGQHLVARGRGGIILLSSLSATMGSAYIANYAATKAYNLVLAEGLWEELRRKGVDVLACCPSAVATPNYLASAPKRAQATMTPDAIVAATLPQLGRRPSFIPGGTNQAAAFIMRRLLPRRLIVRIMGGVMRGMYPETA
jgi:short-subunit dehydrogenase